MVYTLQVFKVLESFVGLISFSYFLGIYWFIMCEWQTGILDMLNGYDENTFITEFGLEKGTPIAIKLTYYGTTTLTTIGLGDFHPISNFERIVCTFYMVCGVAMFSFLF